MHATRGGERERAVGRRRGGCASRLVDAAEARGAWSAVTKPVVVLSVLPGRRRWHRVAVTKPLKLSSSSAICYNREVHGPR
jgi:hypothetical protein